jgi:gamma-glutamylcyclotransferase (GGCT)/AIG2-like uncharacterized protein YtfP
MTMTTKLYLAYGANTDHLSMKVRCPAAVYVCNITLPEHRLVFRGVADVVPTPGAKVECALWMITPACEASLDRFEGFPSFYVKKYVKATLNGRKSRMMFYIMRKQSDREQSPAYASYLSTLEMGYATCGLPQQQLIEATKSAQKVVGSQFVSRQRVRKQSGKTVIRPVAVEPLSSRYSTVPNYRRDEGYRSQEETKALREEDDDATDAYYRSLFKRY